MILFSILIPCIPSRLELFKVLYNRIDRQLPPDKTVEILSVIDNKMRSVGHKRDALVQIANGKYLSFVDDDDDVEPYYVSSILDAINTNENVDLICLKMTAQINNGNRFIVDYGLDYENQEAHIVNGVWQNITRKPFHNCIWKSEIAKSEHFPDASYGEDWHWSKRLIPKVKTSYKIDRVLSHYVYNDKVTEAALVFPKD